MYSEGVARGPFSLIFFIITFLFSSLADAVDNNQVGEKSDINLYINNEDDEN